MWKPLENAWLRRACIELYRAHALDWFKPSPSSSGYGLYVFWRAIVACPSEPVKLRTVPSVPWKGFVISCDFGSIVRLLAIYDALHVFNRSVGSNWVLLIAKLRLNRFSLRDAL